jgi:hypothetical protein
MAYTTINKPSEYFNTKLYSGTGATQSITGVGFQPDWCWIKNASSPSNYSHQLYDVLRGATKRIFSDVTTVQETDANALTSFDSDGFSLGTNVGVNSNGSTLVSWNWKANGAGVSNTDGSITSTVSANTTSGFSVVTYTGTASNATVGHGLGAKPAMIIAKNLTTNGEDWAVYHKSLGGYQYYLKLNGTTAVLTATNRWNAEPDTSVFNVGAVGETNGSGTSQLAYVFVEKKGFSKFGSYTGNGNADGTFVYTGFKPAFVIQKHYSGGATEGWQMWDTKRNTYNLTDLVLMADASSAEFTATARAIDILSNGFKCRGTDASGNASGQGYIYMAFAENPLVGTNGVPATAR